jgi:histidinol-phosphate aminotransferase
MTPLGVHTRDLRAVEPHGECNAIALLASDACAESQVAQLDRNEALRGPPPGAVERVRAAIARAHIYPHEALAHAGAAAASHLGVAPERVILTTGVDEAADLCILELGDPHTVTPGFDGYRDRAAALNHRCRAFPLTDEHELPEELIEATGPGRLVMLCSPNNPTANTFPRESLRAVLERSAYLLLDETYADFCAGAPHAHPGAPDIRAGVPNLGGARDPGAETPNLGGARSLRAGAPGLGWLAEYPNLLVFRSFSKAYGLAGLRIGCVVGAERLIARLRARQAYLTTSGLAAEALIGALESDPDFPTRHAREVVALRAQLIGRLRAVELFERVYESETNFVFVMCASSVHATWIRRTLAEQMNVIVASTAPLGEPAGLRIGVSLQGDADRLIAGLTAIKEREIPT